MRNILIIGASSGIGKKLAIALSKEEYRVFGTYYSNQSVETLPKLSYCCYDAMGEGEDFEFLPDTLDGLVYCPGSINLKPFSRIKPEEFISDYNLQVIGAIKVLQKVLPRLKASKSASVVFFSTVAVQSGFAFHSQVSASKGAIEGLTKSLAAEFAPGIRVNCIAPSLTDTPLAGALLDTQIKKDANAKRHPLKRIGEAEDIANMAAFLISDKASWISGQVLHVDGGLSTLKNVR